MASPFKKASDLSGGSFFKPKENQTALALLIEPKDFQKDVPGKDYNGNPNTRDEVVADITIFGNSESLDKAEPTEIIKSTRITHAMLVGSASKVIGDAFVAVVRMIPTQNGSGYAFRDPEGDAEDRVAAYYEKRESAAADAPDFE